MSRAKFRIWGMLALCASCAWGTPTITQVNVRQQWPWSADIIVDFHLTNNEGTPVDVSIVPPLGPTWNLPPPPWEWMKLALSPALMRTSVPPSRMNLSVA